MKKFSDSSKIKVDKSNVTTNTDTTPEVELKIKLHGLLDEYLRIRFTGPADPVLSGNAVIDGKELVVDALLSLISGEDHTVSVKESKVYKLYERTSGMDTTELKFHVRDYVARISDVGLLGKRLSELDYLYECVGDPERVNIIKGVYEERRSYLMM
jgi:hypothetical protein